MLSFAFSTPYLRNSAVYSNITTFFCQGKY
jgi:hypothetical protein